MPRAHPKTAVLWLRRDLRLADNRTLRAALHRGGPILPVYVHAPEEEAPWAPGAASRWWLHHSLQRLAERLRARGSRLTLRRGPTHETLRDLARAAGADAIIWTPLVDPHLRQRDEHLRRALCADGFEVITGPLDLLCDPETTRTQQGTPYQVFTAFWRACTRRLDPPAPLPAPRRLPPPPRWPVSLAVEDLDLLPKIDWAGGLREAWHPGEAGALANLRRFVREALGTYARDRNRPDRRGTSRLSPHLHFGEISPGQVWHAVMAAAARHGHSEESVSVFLGEIGWREFAHHLLHHFPHTPTEPLRPAFRDFPWKHSNPALRAWQRGTTGYPIVDAGMRELWRTGWMHNRVRMIVASFLVKDLMIPWQEGAAWFWDTLVDADLANNTLGWQWAAGCGADAAPFFRIFNPVTQGAKFDPEGEYVRRWVPEIAALPLPFLHAPWQAPDDVLADAAVTLGRTYPRPIVNHGEARARALAAFERIRR